MDCTVRTELSLIIQWYYLHSCAKYSMRTAQLSLLLPRPINLLHHQWDTKEEQRVRKLEHQQEYLQPYHEISQKNNYSLHHCFEILMKRYLSQLEMRECRYQCWYHLKDTRQRNILVGILVV